MPWTSIADALGLSKGGAVRDALATLWSRTGLSRLTSRTPGHRTTAFTIAVTTLAAKMARADGVALPVEARAFERVFSFPPGEAANVRRLYDQAKQDVAGYEIYAGKVARLLREEPEMLTLLLGCLFHIAAADGILHPAEDAFLVTVAERFGIGRQEYMSIRAGFVHDPSSPYTVLGVSPATPDEELKSHYRALVRQNHPDKFAAAGVPPEFRCAAERRLAAINAAYETILKERAPQRVREAGE
jgi:DnaJ like chaperone protein